MIFLLLVFVGAAAITGGCTSKPEYGIINDKRIVNDGYGNDVYRMVYTISPGELIDIPVSRETYEKYQIHEYAPIEEACECGDKGLF